MDTIYIVVASEEVERRIQNHIDTGRLDEATKEHYQYKSLMEKIRSMISMRSGHILIDVYTRQVFMVPLSVAEEFPQVLEGYKETFKGRLAVGFGLNLKEASAAARKSQSSGRIEFYDEAEEVEKVAPSGAVRFDVDAPQSLFDPLFPVPNTPEEPDGIIPAKRPSLDQELKGEMKLLDAMAQTLGGDEIKQQMQQVQQQMQQMQQAQQQPADLVEALNGGQIPGRKAAQPQEEKPETAKKEEKPEVEDSEEDTSNDKIAAMLGTIKQVIPQLTTLADKNPKAYEHTMKIINKVLGLARSREKTQKSEISLTEQINEALEKARKGRYGAAKFRGITRRHHPIGTVIGRRKKVLVNGKAVWRSVAAGQVQDSKGEPISVRSSNYEAEHPKEPKKK